MRRSHAILGIFILSGAAGLVYEIVWSRQLVLVFGNTTQAVSAILTGFFGGMAIGAAIGGRIADRVRSPLRMYGYARAGAGRRRPRHAAHVPAHPRGVPRDLPGARVDAVPGTRAPGTGGARAGAGDGDDGRDVPGPRPACRSERRSERCLRPAVLGEHDRRSRSARWWPASSSSSCSACPERCSSARPAPGSPG